MTNTRTMMTSAKMTGIETNASGFGAEVSILHTVTTWHFASFD